MVYLQVTLYIIAIIMCFSFLFYLAYKITTKKDDDYLSELLKEEK